ncbi:hypothetical protein CPB83DRAFT_894799 [Crepidotus variabilis]|uniref:Uncharacterized protein n=1 Tax=Crepidotus variabilis TaxID=179855 RepID=A0A9P6EE72_9AGAR|nr:hypothetical protein CPB83DRAFT_894799 [Crepidotus variabilis]
MPHAGAPQMLLRGVGLVSKTVGRAYSTGDWWKTRAGQAPHTIDYLSFVTSPFASPFSCLIPPLPVPGFTLRLRLSSLPSPHPRRTRNTSDLWGYLNFLDVIWVKPNQKTRFAGCFLRQRDGVQPIEGRESGHGFESVWSTQQVKGITDSLEALLGVEHMDSQTTANVPPRSMPPNANANIKTTLRILVWKF